MEPLQSGFEDTSSSFFLPGTQAHGGHWHNSEHLSRNLPGSSTSIGIRQPTKLFRKDREKMLAVSSSASSQRLSSQRSVRLRKLHAKETGSDESGKAGKAGSASGNGASKGGKRRATKAPPPPLTPNQIMIRKLYERINRAYKASLRENVKQVWKENRETLDNFVKSHHRMQSAMATSSILLSHQLVTANDIHAATLKEASFRSTTAEKIKVISMSEKTESISKSGDRVIQRLPVTTLGHVAQIPPVLDWTAIPHNLLEDDGKFLTNIPFLGDEFIDKDAKFIDEMVTLYEGKVHEAKDSSSFRKMDDEVLYSLVQAMMKIEAEEGPDVFKEPDQQAAAAVAILPNPKPENGDSKIEENIVVEEENAQESEEKNQDDASKRISFSDVAAKLFQPDEQETKHSPAEESTPPTEEINATCEMKEECNAKKEAIVAQTYAFSSNMEVEVSQALTKSEQSKPLDTEPEVFPTSAVVLWGSLAKPSDSIFTLLASTFTGLGTKGEIREKYENVEKVKNTPALPILPNGMEKQTPQSYSIPNIEGPFAKYLPKEATMHAYHVLFCRRCFTYDCKRHTGDDQVDVKYYKNRQVPALPSSSATSGLSSLNAFNFLCKDPDCWQMNDVVAKTPEAILLEWSPGDRSLFSCLIESFPSNYCFIAYMMRNKTCVQVKEYADLEYVPKMESCPGESSRRVRGKHRRPRFGFAKKSSMHRHTHTKRSVTRRWINNVKKTEKSKEEGGIKVSGLKLPPRYMPCLHENGGECDSSCTCRINKTSCEKFCTCALTCPYRFPGCKCLSTCDSKRCICFAAARECDPDLCFGCGAHEHSIDKISCHNVNIQRKLHKHLLMGRSDISGWGIYIKNDAQKGDFIAEYRGELISHDESERRGHVYDKIQHTFLFELNDHFVVDATRKGNKARFVNSSKNPNCEVKRMLVNGDHRIGIYAKRFIEAGEELFYDYEDVLEKQQRAAEGAARSKRE